MVTMYRKNKDWKAIFLNVALEDLDNLDTIIGEKVRKDLTPAQKKKKWVHIDIVDTIVVASASNPISMKMTMELLIYVADMTGKISK